LVKKNITNKKTRNKKIGIILLFSVLILALAYSFTFNSNLSVITSDTSVVKPVTSVSISNYLDDFFKFHTIPLDIGNPYFDTYFTERDFNRIQQNLPAPVDGIKLIINESSRELIDILKPNDGTVVIYPTFTSAAYHEPGFYTYFGGNCDESCITDLSFENVDIIYTSSGNTAQILHAVGYDFITDIDVDKNPEILQNYDTVILLHNEYVTKKMFDAISSHPRLIFLAPNALYAEIDVNYADNTMTLIRGHQYPPPENPANGFDYKVEQDFHKYEYDTKCLEWKFLEIKNGFHLNCYPDGVIHQKLDILLKMKDL
jgi:hypothetical protein